MAPSPLGVFGRLPVEIRFLIWEHFYPQGDNGHTDLAILRTSSAIYNEITTFLKWPQSLGHLEFEITPKPDHDVIFRIYNASRSIRWSIDTLWFNKPAFDYLPLDKLKTVVTIEAPEGGTDPGQLFCLWEKCYTLVGLFNHINCGDIQCLDIKFRDTRETTWLIHESVGNRNSFYPVSSMLTNPAMTGVYLPPEFDIDDISILLRTFRPLRRVSALTIELSQQNSQLARESGFVTALQLLINDEVLKFISGFSLPVQNAAMKSNVSFLLLDFMLDQVTGPTADRLRLQRFAQWAEQTEVYEEGILGLFHECQHRLKTTGMDYRVWAGLWSRYCLMRFTDPQFCRGQVQLTAEGLSSDSKEAVLAVVISNFLNTSMAAPDEWYASYEGGLPHLDSAFWNLTRAWFSEMTIAFGHENLEGTFWLRLLGAIN